MYPKSFEKLLDNFKKLPGIGEKSAERFVYSICDFSDKDVKEFSDSLVEFKNLIKRCEICNHLSDTNICNICSDKTRDNDVICVVPDSKSVFMFEKSENYRGTYHVLNGVISPAEGISAEDINLYTLINNRIKDTTKEIIIALNSNIAGEITSLYIQKLLENKNIRISRLSYGIPMGMDIEYLDPTIITKALDDRKTIS